MVLCRAGYIPCWGHSGLSVVVILTVVPLSLLWWIVVVESSCISGVLPTVLRQGCNQAVNFTLYDLLKRRAMEYKEQVSHDWLTGGLITPQH